MPLTFLSTDSSHQSHAAEEVLPYEAEDRWRRPYRPGPWRVAGSALLLMLASYMLFAGMIIGLAGALPGAGLCLLLAALVIAAAVRLVRVGIWVNEAGLRQVGLLHSVTLPWSRVESVRTSQQPVKWLGMPRTVQGQAVVVTTASGERLRAVLTDRNADFLGRGEAFDMAADAVEGWAEQGR
ncbi:hypothetical protein ACFW9F_18880 [Streptomyces sp. NPDC059506]|uniref:Membrane protein n=1 Tax=Streptomyces thermolineatus TaxID=44033 RepID=A0ABN3MXE7_9ACTN|nr:MULTISPECIES: hypothetical protein [unclassified Streptomyces]MCZ2528221.1 hypothetical protein [Streptomyces sp. HB2AG]PLW73277.1 hypothetical protein C0036_08140 [Streptomyces sp. DJ]QMV24919.1 hypothetical protein GQS52_06615 [Streptomyces sp. SCUT-3]